MPTNYNLKPKRLKQKLNNIERPENRVHRLIDSNGSCDPRHLILIKFILYIFWPLAALAFI